MKWVIVVVATGVFIFAMIGRMILKAADDAAGAVEAKFMFYVDEPEFVDYLRQKYDVSIEFGEGGSETYTIKKKAEQ